MKDIFEHIPGMFLLALICLGVLTLYEWIELLVWVVYYATR
jgi:hypothetical protein